MPGVVVRVQADGGDSLLDDQRHCLAGEALPLHPAVSVHGVEDGAFVDLRPLKPLVQRRDWAPASCSRTLRLMTVVMLTAAPMVQYAWSSTSR